MLLNLTFHVINLLLALIATAVVTMIIFRTRKGLDKVFKFFLGTTITLVIATAMQVNGYTGLIPVNYEQVIFVVSRLLASLFFLAGLVMMLHVIDKESR